MKRLLIALLLLLAPAIASAQTVVIGQSGMPVTLDTGQDGNSLTPAIQIVEQLVGYVQSGAEIQPLLATDWSSNDDATVWTFNLREGISFHDGEPFNAEAVKYNFDRWNLRSHPDNYVDEGKPFTSFTYVFGGYHGDEDYLIEEVNVVGEHTVEFVLTGSNYVFPLLTASSYFGLHSPKAAAEGGIQYGTPAGGAVGTGPFIFKEWIDGDRLSMVRNDDYWGQVAGVDELVFRGIESPTSRLAELEAGSIHLALNLSPESAGIVADSDKFRAVTPESDLVLGYLGMHQGNAPFDDLRVRQAFAYAIDSDAIIEAFYGELASTAGEFIPPGLSGHTGNEPYPYDPEKAKELLAEAGYPNGFDTEFWYMPVSRPYYPAPKDIAEAVASYLGDVGINAELNTEDWGIYLDNYLEGKFPIYMLGWSADFPDADNFISSFFNQANAVGFGYENPELWDLINQGQATPEGPEREEIYAQITKILHDDLPAMPFVNTRTLNAAVNGLEGFYPNPLGSTVPFNTITLE